MEPNYFGQWKQSIVKQLRDTKKDKFIRRLDDDSLVINYLTYIRECVLHSVTVHESKDILKQLPTLSPNEAANYQRIKSNLISGSGISPYLSTNASKLRPDDLFLALGIMHLHMGQIMDVS
ncbi:hypothetical protein [Furfurilactobacillus milii]|uniref:Uncharacterized protein n=1 Tax=Furfurilactobacillus rossiae TaxID=231049 RepID=A0A7C9IU28_9LACO|nr:hypothetical protein [Furfurilactobacillus milii]MYV05919.1 hypothetical protein [Furfurilactobacillus milii]